ncbi:exported protein of unknown function [Blastococcus saxobsidens DD2]|uniref:Uncharacterized protein n=1 Tax=Blastococcus saxobsidens (strain DD2) TaxID=1146883 RepID=H6RLP6_BLASD|nr:exported protein of unknown function [Blastococcus saxobsidens DD2]
MTRSSRTVSTSWSTAAMAPMASSGCHGTPTFRTTTTSRAPRRARATSAAITTPPRGSPSTTSSGAACSARRTARARPASVRSVNGRDVVDMGFLLTSTVLFGHGRSLPTTRRNRRHVSTPESLPRSGDRPVAGGCVDRGVRRYRDRRRG